MLDAMGFGGWIRAAFAVPVPPTMNNTAWPAGFESPWANPDVLTRVTVADLWPGAPPAGWEDYAPITRDEAMTVPAVAAARHRITGTLARLPIDAVTTAGDAWAGDASLLDQPDPAEPHVATMTKTIDDLLFAGRSYWAVTKTNANGFPTDVVHVPLVNVMDNDGWPDLDTAFTEWVTRSNRQVLPLPVGYTPDGLPWLIGFNGPHSGLCTFGARAIRAGVSLDRAVSNASANPVPSVELHQTTDADIDEIEAAAMVTAWEAARQRHGAAFTNNAVEVKTHGQHPEQLLINGRNQQAVEVARLAGIPAASIDAGIPGSNLTYANLVDRLRDLISFGLQPYAAAYTGRLSMDDVTPHGVRAILDYSELLPDVPGGNKPAPVTPAVTP